MALRSTDYRRDVRARRVRRVYWQFAGKIAISLFLLWHLFALAMYNLPYQAPLITWAMPAIRPYMIGSGFMQGWGMFAPDPFSLDLYLTANVHYADGTVRTWEFPRMEHMGFWERYQKERWRKYAEIVHQDSYKFLWPPMARYVARVNNIYPNNPPVSVDLVRHWRNVRAPDQAPAAFDSFQFCTVQIKPEDLR